MSLINDALQDLAARESERGRSPAENMALQPQASRKTSANKLVPLSLCLVVAAAFLYFHQAQNFSVYADPVKKPKSSPSLSSGSPTAPVLVEQASAAETEDKAASDIPATLDVASEDARVDLAQRIDEPTFNSEIEILINSAKRAIAKNRLSRPAEDNALGYIDKALSLDENNTQAKALREKVKEKYKKIVVAAIAASNESETLQGARTLVERAQLSDISAKEQGALLAQIADKEAQIAVANTAVISKADHTLNKGKESATIREVIQGEPQPDEAVDIAGSQATFSLSLEQQDLNALQRAKDVLVKNGITAALSELENVNNAHQEFYHTRIFAADLLLAESRDADVRRMLAQCKTNHPAHAYIKTRLLALDAGEDIAIAFLRKKEALKIHEKRLLAAMFQKTKRSQEAYFLYQDLLREDGNNDTFLLGFALSADALEKYAQSARAYRALLQSSQHDSKVLAFIKSRLAQLKTDELAEASVW